MKNNLFVQFCISSILLSVLSLGVVVGVHVFVSPEKSFASLFFLIPFVMFVTILFHFVLIKASAKNPQRFVGKFAAFSGIKLMIYLISILVYAFVIKNGIVIFLIGFLIIYLLFTILEISAILKFLKKSGS